jgi:hypothetical protein
VACTGMGIFAYWRGLWIARRRLRAVKRSAACRAAMSPCAAAATARGLPDVAAVRW